MLSITTAVLALAAGASPGEEKYVHLGVALDVPGTYEGVPVQPTEPWIVLRYVGAKGSKARPAVRPALYLVKIERKADPEPCPDPPPINSFQRYLVQRWQAWEVEAQRAGKAREGWECREYDLASPESSTLGGWAFEHAGPERSWILLGFCERGEVEREARTWRRVAEKLEFFEASEHKDAAKWAKFYAKNPRFRNPELRLRLRTRLVSGWEAEDSENYLIVYSTKKASLIQHLQKRLEGIRRSYVELFPPVSAVEAVSTVRVCKDQDEYHRYGGPPGTAGYWNPKSEELVLFVFESSGGDWQSGKEDSRYVMFHEAFHQYIHYAVGEVAPHSWFNEGYGDYFSGAEFDQHGNVGRILVNSWRVGLIQQAIRSGLHSSWREMGWMEKPAYYGSNRPINYAMGWSMVYFLNKSKDVRKDPTWSRILPVYFETLKAANTRERARLAAAGLLEDEEELEKANAKVRKEAADASFTDVDLLEIESAWRDFVLELKPPK
jgi:hypothetical protein